MNAEQIRPDPPANTGHDVDGYPLPAWPSERARLAIMRLAGGESHTVALTPNELAYVVRCHGRHGLIVQECDEATPNGMPADARLYCLCPAPGADQPLFPDPKVTT